MREHDQWAFFDKVKDDNGRTVGAKCLACKRYQVRRDKQSLLNHRFKYCTSAQPTVQSDQVNKYGLQVQVPLAVSTEGVNGDTGTYQPVDSSDKSVFQKKVNILNFFLYHGLDFSSINNKCTVDLFQSLDDTLELPTAEELSSDLMKQAGTLIRATNQDKGFSNIICIKIHEDEKNYCFLALLYSHSITDEPTFIECRFFEKTNDFDVSKSLDTFICQSISKTYVYYKVIVKFVLHDGLIPIQSPVNVSLTNGNGVMNYKCFMVTSINCIMRKLKSITFSVSAKDSDISIVQTYISILTNLEKSTQQFGFPLSDAIQSLLSLVNENTVLQHLCIADQIKQTLNSSIEGVHLTCNYFHPRHHGESFNNFWQLVEKFESYVQTTGYADMFDFFCYYKHKIGLFQSLNAERTHHDVRKFWDAIKVKNSNIARYALDHLRIPASTCQLNMQLVAERFLKYRNFAYECHCCLFSVLWQNRD